MSASLQRASATRSSLAVLGAACLGLCVWLAVRQVFFDGGSRRALTQLPQDAGGGADAFATESSEACARQAESLCSGAAADELTAHGDGQAPRGEPQELCAQSLRTAIETTLVSQIDPGEFLDTALALTRLDVRATPIPESHPSGALRYPVLGTPEGVNAELWVRRSDNAAHGGPVLSYRISLPAAEGYLMEGAERTGLDAEITLWTDKSGQCKNFAIYTDCRPTPDTVRASFGSAEQIPTGALFSCDTEHPMEWTAKDCLLQGGMPKDSTQSQPAVRGQWPRTDDLNRLKTHLQRVYSSL